MTDSLRDFRTLDDAQTRLERAFVALLARVTPYFGGGGPGYHGIRVENLAPDGSEVDLILTFRAAERYCCAELGCHCNFESAGYWSELRALMDNNGLSPLPLPTIRRVRVVAEVGASFDPGGPRRPLRQGFSYECGPFPPVSETEGGSGLPSGSIEE